MTKSELRKEMERLNSNALGGDFSSAGAIVGHLTNIYNFVECKHDPAVPGELQTIIDRNQEQMDDMYDHNGSVDSNSKNYQAGYISAILDVVSAFKASFTLDK